MKVRPHGSMVLIRHEPNMEKDGHIILPGSTGRMVGHATVVSVGPLAHDLKPGDRVVHVPYTSTRVTEDMSLIPRDDVMAVLE